MAKNLILAGANITILDTHLITEYDTDTNFLFTIKDLGKKVDKNIPYYREEK